jgi:hypothetical protein
MPELRPVASWPGIDAIISANYTCSHGISPGTATLTCIEQPTLPAMEGDLVLGDGQTSVTLYGCRIDNIKLSVYGNGDRIWTVFIKDRRWRWLGYGTIFGCYNQLDPNNKLIGWTIRSPAELATLCLQNMGEVNYVLNLPPGLSSAWGANLQNFLQAGENFPLTGLNPPINWNGDTPAAALQQVAEQFGCRVVFDAIANRVLVVPIGVGNGLPDGYVKQYGPSIKQVPLPDGIIVIGDRTKFQMRLLMEPVGLEWDGSYRPLEQLSYAPFLLSRPQITTIRIRTGAGFEPMRNSGEWQVAINGVMVEHVSNPGDSRASVVAGLVALINAHPQLAPIVTAQANGLDIIVTARQDNRPFILRVRAHGLDEPTMETRPTQAASGGGRGFDFEDPNSFTGVVATNRLTYDQAQRLALASVFRCYRVANTGLNGRGRIYVPGYGFILRRQQLELTPTMVEQIAPEIPDETVVRRNQNLDPNAVPDQFNAVSTEFIQNFYNGYSRERPAVAYGTFASDESGAIYLSAASANTPGDARILVDFSVDPVWQVITFARPIYRYREAGGGDVLIVPSKVTLETGCYLREADTNQFAAFTLSRKFNAGGPTSFYETRKCEDVQLGVIGRYTTQRVGLVPGSGETQVTRVQIRNLVAPSQPLVPFADAGTWTLSVNGAAFLVNSTIGQTPADVAQAFSDQIPANQNYTVTLDAANATLTFTGNATGFGFNVLGAVPPNPRPNITFYEPFGMTVQIVRTPVADLFDVNSLFVGAQILEADPIFRANYYLNGMMLKYQVKETATVVYNTIMPIACDGAIAQVTWEVGDGRPVQTTASLNCEHSDWVPPYPVRRRAEVLPPVLAGDQRLGQVGGGAPPVLRF